MARIDRLRFVCTVGNCEICGYWGSILGNIYCVLSRLLWHQRTGLAHIRLLFLFIDT